MGIFLVYPKYTQRRVRPFIHWSFLMVEVINLNKKRKARARTDNEKKAAQNRVNFGRTKDEKNLEKLNAKRAEQRLEGHKLETGENE
jgi:hypothetical protein